MMPEPCIVIITTADNKQTLVDIADSLIGQRIAACVQILGPISSHYQWKGEAASSTEWRAEIKTRQCLFDRVAQSISEIHSYELPEIIALDIVDCSHEYQQWIYDQTTDKET